MNTDKLDKRMISLYRLSRIKRYRYGRINNIPDYISFGYEDYYKECEHKERHLEAILK